MGLFSTKCEKCGHKISKLARHCSKCGAPSPAGWDRCPACKAEVGSDSAFCWKCGGFLLAPEGDETLSLAYVGVRTREDVAVNVSVDVVVHVTDSTAFGNLARGQTDLSDEVIADLLRAETLNVLQARLKQVSVKDLPGNADLKTAIETDLRDGMATTLERNGLELVQLRFVDFWGDGYEKVRQARGETFVAEEMADESERRAALNKRLRETLTRDKMDSFATAQDLADFIRQTEHETGMKDVIRQEEMVDLKRTYEEKHEDADIARRHLLEKLELEHDLAKRRLARTGEAEELDHELDQARKALADKQQHEWDQHVQDIKIRAAEHDQDVKEAQDGIELVRQMKAVNLEHKQAEQQMEVDRITALSNAGTEALIAGSDSEKAAMLMELKKTEMLKDYSEEQILALAADKSPAVAEAFKEKFRAADSAEQQQQINAMYEKMVAEQKESSGTLAEVQQHHAEMMANLFQQALTTQGEVAKAAAQSHQPQVVFPPPGTQPTAIGQPPAARACPKCGAPAKPDNRFCDRCGAELS